MTMISLRSVKENFLQFGHLDMNFVNPVGTKSCFILKDLQFFSSWSACCEWINLCEPIISWNLQSCQNVNDPLN